MIYLTSCLPADANWSPSGESNSNAKPPPFTVPHYSTEAIEGFISETKLCEFCKVMFGPKDGWIPKFAGLNSSFKHHQSYESLLLSAETGCLVCSQIYEMVHAGTRVRRGIALQAFRTFNLSFDDNLRQYGRNMFAEIEDETRPSRNLGFLISFDFYDCKIHTWVPALFRAIILIIRYTRVNILIIVPSKTSLICPKSTGREADLALVRSWVDKCSSGGEGGHATCKQYRHPKVPYKKPTRLIYVDPGQPETMRLVPVSEQGNYPYVTLSHRWGLPPADPPKLSDLPGRQTSIERLQAGVPVSELPQTFQDAIRIVQACNLNYIWIDSLCIIQEGPGADWTQESAKMGDIYAGGIL